MEKKCKIKKSKEKSKKQKEYSEKINSNSKLYSKDSLDIATIIY